MIRLTIKTAYKNGSPEFPLRVHTLRFAGIFTMKDSELQDELKKFEEANPEQKVLSWNKDIIRDSQREAMELAAEQAPEEPEAPVELNEEPL